GSVGGPAPSHPCLACFVGGAEGAGAGLLEELDLAGGLGGLSGQPTASGVGVDLDAGAAARADDGFGGRITGRQRTLAMGTGRGHGNNTAEKGVAWAAFSRALPVRSTGFWPSGSGMG